MGFPLALKSKWPNAWVHKATFPTYKSKGVKHLYSKISINMLWIRKQNAWKVIRKTRIPQEISEEDCYVLDPQVFLKFYLYHLTWFLYSLLKILLSHTNYSWKNELYLTIHYALYLNILTLTSPPSFSSLWFCEQLLYGEADSGYTIQ